MPLPCRLKPGLLALGCAGLLLLSAPAQAADKPASKKSSQAAAMNKLPPLSSEQLLGQMFLSEIAFARGMLDEAASGYKDLARRSNDPRIQRRANEIELARIAQFLHKNPAEAEASFRKQLAERPDIRAALLLQLPGIYANLQDKQQILASIQRLAAPYDQLAEAHYIHSLALDNAENQAEAYTEALRSHELKPDWAPALLQLQQTAPAEQHDKVGQLLKDFCQRNPDELNARVGLVRWLTQDKNFPAAKDEIRQLLSAHPDNPALAYALAGAAIEIGDRVQAENIISDLIGQGWGNLDQLHLVLAQLQAEQGRLDDARNSLDNIEPGPLFVAAQSAKATLIAGQGKLDDARASLRRAVTLSPTDRPALLLHESQLLRRANQNAAAFEVLNEVLAQQPDHVATLYESALLADQLELPDELERRLRRVLELTPDNAHANNALGYSLADRNVRLDEAEKLLEHAISLSPEDPAILDSLGWLRFRQNRLSEAEQLLRKAFAHLPDPEIAAHLIQVLWQDGRANEAKAEYARALKSNPESTLLLDLAKHLPLN